MASESPPPNSRSTQDRLSLYRLKDKLVVQEALGCLLSNAPSLIRLIESQFLHPLIDLPDGLLIASRGDQDPANIDLKNPNISFRLYRPEDILTDNKLFTFSEYLRDLTFYPHFYPQIPQTHPVFPPLVSQRGKLREGDVSVKVLTIIRPTRESIVGCISVYSSLGDISPEFEFRPVILDKKPAYLVWDNNFDFSKPEQPDHLIFTSDDQGNLIISSNPVVASKISSFRLTLPLQNLQVLTTPPK